MLQTPFTERRSRLLALVAGVVLATSIGWWLFWFLTDDAFIAFRYVSNSVMGRGLVWNPAPFRAVEGYTSWLWVVLLRQIWVWGGVEPPAAANVLSLCFGYATLFVVYKFVERAALPRDLERHRLLLLGWVWLGVVSNPTFLTWLSSGLETALFNFTFLFWIYCAVAPSESRGRGWTFQLCLAATLSALTRPDGLLLVAATPVLIGLDLRERPLAVGRRRWRVLELLPLAGSPIHVLWRKATYGEWLPNTFTAKQVAAWPESGLRYAASFALEYALWIWLCLALVWWVRDRRIGLASWVTVAVVIAHFAYYTLMIGGDHFEYRVYSHLIPLIFVSLMWMVGRLSLGVRAASAVLGLAVLCSWPIPWVHYFETRDVVDREVAFKLFRPVAPRFPPLLRGYAQAFDGLQSWLIEHYVGMRRQEHKVFLEFQRERLPSRAQGAEMDWRERSVADIYSVGYAGWVLPNVAIIDQLGLNDYVVARHDDVDLARRTMAHDRRPPPGYVACFRPNIFFEGLELRFESRNRPLTDAEIVACESSFLARVQGSDLE